MRRCECGPDDFLLCLLAVFGGCEVDILYRWRCLYQGLSSDTVEGTEI